MSDSFTYKDVTYSNIKIVEPEKRIDSEEFSAMIAAVNPEMSERQKDLILGMFLGHVAANIAAAIPNDTRKDGKLSLAESDHLVKTFQTMQDIAQKGRG